MNLKYRVTCRICGSASLKKVIDLGERYLQGSFMKPGSDPPPMRKIPTALVHCDPIKDENACGLVQMAHSLPQNNLYSSYWYRSGSNKTMRNHLRGIADETADPVRGHALRVLDIGCNDGTLL